MFKRKLISLKWWLNEIVLLKKKKISIYCVIKWSITVLINFFLILKFQKNRVVREIFYNAAFVDGMAERRGSHTIATLRDHSHFFVSLISQVIQSIDSQTDDISEHITKIGDWNFEN